MGGKYITERQRYEIECYCKLGMKPKQIAELTGKSIRTIYYELKRGKCIQRNSLWEEKEVYLADVAQAKYLENRTAKGAKLKIGKDIRFAEYVELMIREYKYSPYAVLQSIKNSDIKFDTEICTTTLYSYIDKEVFLTITNKDLPVKHQDKKQSYKRTVAHNNLKGRSIEQRPDHINNRADIGHWEMDTVVGSQHSKQCLLVLTERKTLEEMIIRIPDKRSASVVNVLNRIERKIGTNQFRATFKTITTDNGVEFLDFQGIEKGYRNKSKRRTTIYYCHPYSSWERGRNENANKLIRRFIPKGSRIEDYTDEQLTYIENWMNHYPRKALNGKSAWMLKRELCMAA